MPTPMPIIDATCGANEGTSSRCPMRPINEMPMPIPKSAVTIGRPIASSDPNATSKMTIAASRPMISAKPNAGCSAFSSGPPVASNCSPSALAAFTSEMSFFATDTGTSAARVSKCTSAYAILRSAEMRC